MSLATSNAVVVKMATRLKSLKRELTYRRRRGLRDYESASTTMRAFAEAGNRQCNLIISLIISSEQVIEINNLSRRLIAVNTLAVSGFHKAHECATRLQLYENLLEGLKQAGERPCFGGQFKVIRNLEMVIFDRPRL